VLLRLYSIPRSKKINEKIHRQISAIMGPKPIAKPSSGLFKQCFFLRKKKNQKLTKRKLQMLVYLQEVLYESGLVGEGKPVSLPYCRH